MGNLWAIFLLVTVGSATFSSFGLIVASVTNTMQETQVINQVIWTAFRFFPDRPPGNFPILYLRRFAFHASHLSGHRS